MRRLTNDTLVVKCGRERRLVFFGADLMRRDELFVLGNGVVAVADGLGVYASPPSLRKHGPAFEDAGRKVLVPHRISLAVIRQALFDLP